MTLWQASRKRMPTLVGVSDLSGSKHRSMTLPFRSHKNIDSLYAISSRIREPSFYDHEQLNAMIDIVMENIDKDLIYCNGKECTNIGIADNHFSFTSLINDINITFSIPKTIFCSIRKFMIGANNIWMEN